ncbi:TPD1 protein homolog 1A-like isoform X2 [Diospyros lotus]|uniref:TPD1 protein homolog 1A-like isoform X2 n=1 Tax=Diospyros lotus TaxID=55363 RepID=UPI0022592540|nr:TPD1 protein homolog 1A-like isoform X2 [Diospyros lotus]
MPSSSTTTIQDPIRGKSTSSYICRHVPGEIAIAQARTGKLIKGKPEWNVTFKNPCICTQLEIFLTCTGFKTVEKIDSRTLLLLRGRCRLYDGAPIYGGHSLSFKYAWDHPYAFKIANATIACS